MSVPDSRGFFGSFGGAYAPDTLMPALHELEASFKKIASDPSFSEELNSYLSQYVGRPSPLYFAKNLSDHYGYQIYLKREDLNHTGAHKINNTLGQVLLAKRMGKTRIIAETGAGQHGVATATACALLSLPCEIYMGAEDVKRQALNVYRMELLGATVHSVSSGSQTLKDATTEAMRDWMGSVEHTYYVIGSALGPHPYPMMVREFQRIIGKESKEQCLDQLGRLPHHLIACVGGGSNAIGFFYDFIADTDVNLIAVEAAGKGLDSLHAASLTKGRPGVLHGSKNILLQDKNGQIELAESISAGLDYPGVGPELCYLMTENRLTVDTATDDEAVKACRFLAQTEGIIPALESSHAVAALAHSSLFSAGDLIVLCVSGRGDKDMEMLRNYERIK